MEMLETSKRLLGNDHPTTTMRKGNLASTYWQHGRLKEAEEPNLEAPKESERARRRAFRDDDSQSQPRHDLL
jgi:hypothetical protein